MMELCIDGEEADICEYGRPFSRMFSNARLFGPCCFYLKVRVPQSLCDKFADLFSML